MYVNKNSKKQEKDLGVLMQRFFTHLTSLNGENTTFGNLSHESKKTITKVLNKLKSCLLLLSQKGSYNLQDAQQGHASNNNPGVDTFKKLEPSLSGDNSASPGNVVAAKPTADELRKKDIDSIRKAVRKLSDFQENKATLGEMKATLEEALGALKRATKRAEGEAKENETSPQGKKRVKNNKAQQKKLKKAFTEDSNILEKLIVTKGKNVEFQDLTKNKQKKLKSGIEQCQLLTQLGRNNNNINPNKRLYKPIATDHAEQKGLAG